ncbi:MAG: hypothetical protein M1828_006071 [Chrysothrix sp. TS-e1954]|nr:MAG: hypothetical protein M1828_006071 [Chrysothrix sp. TS-e1954]
MAASETGQHDNSSPPMTVSLRQRLVSELGLSALARSTIDTKLLCIQRFVRLTAYGASALILALFLSDLGITDTRIGLFMTLTLLGDVCISFTLTLFADGLGRKNILVIGSALMVLSGAVFAVSENYWILVVASIFGVISPSGNEIGPFRAIEESTLAQLSAKEDRGDIFAWYTMIGTLGLALGQLTCGWVVDRLQQSPEWTHVQAYKVVFVAYAVIGCVKLVLALLLSKACEQPPVPPKPSSPFSQAAAASESDPLIEHRTPQIGAQEASESEDKPSKFRWLLPNISRESRVVVLQLLIFFTFDAFASGLVTTSWLAYFFKRKFAIDAGVLGTIFFVTLLIAALSNLVAASIARRIGLIKTMVFTHLPSAIFLALIPLPKHAAISVVFLVLRSCTSNMDTAPRQAFTAAAVLSSERTAVMGIINVVRTLAQSGAPSLTGWLVQTGRFWIVFVLAGAMKAGYDVGMLLAFVNFPSREEQQG